jgi:hypothetical protein
MERMPQKLIPVATLSAHTYNPKGIFQDVHQKGRTILSEKKKTDYEIDL